MPAIASCASARHQPPVLSASRARVILPPSVGFAVSVYTPGMGPLPPTASRPVAPLGVLPPLGVVLSPPPLLLPQAESAIAVTSARATTPAPFRLRDPKTFLTCSP